MSYSSIVLGDSPSYYWQLQETSGTTATDSAGTNTGTYHTGFTLGQQAPPMGGTSVLFNGSSGYMSTAQTIANDSTSFSIELWFNSTAKNVPLAMIANPGQGDAIVGLNSSGNLVGSVANSTESAWNDTTTTGVYNDGKWHYVCYTVASSSASIYVDGALSKTTTGITVDASAGRNNTWALAYNISGSHSYGTYANGYFAHFAVWNTTTLTATQVSNHYNAASGGGGTAHTVTLSDSIATSDTISLVRTLHVAFSDSITSSDTIAKSVGHALTFSDSVSSSDSIATAQAHAYALSFSDGITTSDNEQKATSEILHDAIMATDAMAQVRTYFRNYADSVATSDSLTKQIARALAFSDGVTVTDAMTAQKVTVYSIHLSDSVRVTDAITSLNRILSIALSDSVGTSDSVTMTGGKILNPIRGSIQLLASLDNKITLLASLDNKIELLAGVAPVAQTNQNFTLEQFSSDVLTFTYGGDLSGCTLEWIMQYNVNSLSPLIKKTFADGISITSTSSSSSTFTVSITNTDMANIGQGSYYHQASVVDALSESNPISKGTVTVSAASNN